MNLTFISAGAGSGKTYKLTEIISQAVESGVSPERIIATTFTNKASDEIRERVTEAFFKKGDLGMVQRAPAITIGTVNSVCGQLLGKFAFEAGLSPRLRVIEVEESASLLRRVMERSVSPADRGTFFEIERALRIRTRSEGFMAANRPGHCRRGSQQRYRGVRAEAHGGAKRGGSPFDLRPRYWRSRTRSQGRPRAGNPRNGRKPARQGGREK